MKQKTVYGNLMRSVSLQVFSREMNVHFDQHHSNVNPEPPQVPNKRSNVNEWHFPPVSINHDQFCFCLNTVHSGSVRCSFIPRDRKSVV